MKIAYLILAHQDPTQLNKLICALNTENCVFFIHIDKKVDVAPFLLNIQGSNVIFTEDRFEIRWGGFSIVKATFSLIENLINSKFNFDRVQFLSGLDYPILSNDLILKEFTDNPNKQYLTGYNISKGQNKAQKSRIRRYYFFDSKVKWFGRILNYIFMVIPVRKQEKVFFSEKFNDIFFSSQWFSINKECLYYIYDIWKIEKKIISYFKNSYAPDELFIPTIIFNSRYANQTVILPTEPSSIKYEYLTTTHHIEYTQGITIFDESNYDKIIDSKKMFFRKVNSDKSVKLLSLIDSRRKKCKDIL